MSLALSTIDKFMHIISIYTASWQFLKCREDQHKSSVYNFETCTMLCWKIRLLYMHLENTVIDCWINSRDFVWAEKKFHLQIGHALHDDGFGMGSTDKWERFYSHTFIQIQSQHDNSKWTTSMLEVLANLFCILFLPRTIVNIVEYVSIILFLAPIFKFSIAI